MKSFEHISDLFLDFLERNLDQGLLPTYEECRQSIIEKLDYWELPSEEGKFLVNSYERVCLFSNLKQHLVNENLTEFIVHDYQNAQIEKFGICGLANIKLDFNSKRELALAMRVIAFKDGQRWNDTEPFKSFQLELFDSSYRITLIHSSLSPDLLPKAFFRKIKNVIIELNDFFNCDGQEVWMKKSITDKKNIIISGCTGSGKTTFMNSVISWIPQSEHIVLLEDVHEFPLSLPHITTLLSQTKSLVDYTQYALRMRPDRIMVGELRGKEITPFFLSMNTGHNGMLTTLHANSAADALDRLCTLFCLYNGPSNVPYEKVSQLICQNLDFVIHMENKEVKEIIKVLGSEKGTPIFRDINIDPLSKNEAFEAVLDLN